MTIITKLRGPKDGAILVTRVSEERVMSSQRGHPLSKQQLAKRLSITAMANGGDNYLRHTIKGLKHFKTVK